MNINYFINFFVNYSLMFILVLFDKLLFTHAIRYATQPEFHFLKSLTPSYEP